MIIMSSFTWAKPEWMTDVTKECKKSELCAVGMGESRLLAAASARANLAKIFSVKVDSKFSLTEFSDNQSVNSSSFENIVESTDLDLSGAEIVKTYRGDQYDYALARIKKHVFARTIEKQMNEIADEINKHLDEEHIASVSFVEKQLISWRLLDRRREFLVGIRKSAPVSTKNLTRLRNSLTQGKKLAVNYDGMEKKRIHSFLKDYFSSLGYETTKSEKRATHLVQVDTSKKKANFNVSGFEKYHYTFNLRVLGSNKRVLGELSIETTQTGRDEGQCFTKAYDHFKKQLDTKISQIKMRRI